MSLTRAHDILRQTFGYDSFRPNQAEIVSAISEGHDCLVIMPTGGGKSICFQVPALMREGTTLVVSPLIALMKDQVEALKGNGVSAAYLNSSLSGAEYANIEADLLRGEIKLLYVSPEKLVSPEFRQTLDRVKVSGIAIDEAHCISEWGHDFRPEYQQLSFLHEQFPNAAISAFTATADKLTRKDIATQLNLRNPKKFLASFDRPNLSLTVLAGRDRFNQIVRFLRPREGQSGIIYCLSRKSTEKLAQKLKAKGINAAHYHAGMSSEDRSRVQEDFINDNTPIICATIAFGMGIDKSNVRWVMHYNLPKNVEGYYQEIGRAGRDGLPSDTVLFYSFGDVLQLREMLGNNDNSDVQLSKLERMQQYAEALICRRKILLSYFGEHLEENCGNCDVCQNPPSYFDGTTKAQMALSAVARTNQQASVTMLCKILIGSSQHDVIEAGWHTIKTYGVGRMTSFQDWQQYVMQMVNFGLLEVAYDDHNALRMTEQGKEVLYGKRAIELVNLEEMKAKTSERLKKVERKPRSQREAMSEDLFERLRQLRKAIAMRDKVPPYIVFSDASLQEMASERPTSPAEFLDISGVGDSKLKKYGSMFLEAISDFVADKAKKGKQVKGGSQLVTLDLYKQGMSLAEMATHRQLAPGTITAHLVQLKENGYDIDLRQYVSDDAIRQVHEASAKVGPGSGLGAIHEALNGSLGYDQIRLALACRPAEEKGEFPRSLFD